MKLLTRNSLVAFFMAFGLMLTMQSCDDCNDVNCQNGGSCVDGSCECPAGFSGDECQTNLCDGVDCMNGGTQVVTASSCGCDCPDNFSGDNCETNCRDNFLGTYTGQDGCTTSGSNPTNATIATSAGGDNQILISGFWGGGFTAAVAATTSGCNTVTIPLQDPDNDGFTIEGSGTSNDDGATITFSFTVTDTSDGTTDICNVTLTKQ